MQAFSAKYNGGGEDQVVATPTAACSPAVLPSAPINLSARPGSTNVTLCWDPPANNGCVDEWRVAVRVADDQVGGAVARGPAQLVEHRH